MNMFSKEEFIEIVARDLTILKHIHGQILPGTENYRPTEKQRSILELIQYLGFAYSAGTEVIIKGDAGIFETYRSTSNEITLANFPEHIDKAIEIIKRDFGALTEEQINEPLSLFGMPAMPKRFWAMELLLKSVVAYKTQLFLYIKATGNDKIGTSDLWSGVSSNN